MMPCRYCAAEYLHCTTRATGASLKHIDFEKTESFGVNSLAAFTWKDLLDLDACTECGRCTAVCPAHTVGKELSPRDIVLGLRDLMRNDSLTSNPAIIGSIPSTPRRALAMHNLCGVHGSLSGFYRTDAEDCRHAQFLW
jgi:ferredoxin